MANISFVVETLLVTLKEIYVSKNIYIYFILLYIYIYAYMVLLLLFLLLCGHFLVSQ